MQLLVAFAQFGPDARVYRVGGAVRDSLLSHPYTETDWVVVGTTPDALLDAGFKQVGADFPVFTRPRLRNMPLPERSVNQVRVIMALRYTPPPQ